MNLLNELRHKPLHLAMLVVLAIAAALYLYSMQIEKRYDDGARNYLQRTLADVSNWQPQTLRRHLAPAAQQAVSEEQLTALVQRYATLGAYRRIDDLRFARLTAALSLLKGDTLLGYSGTVHFEQGSAHLSAMLQVESGQYHLYNFNLSTPQTSTP